MRIAVLGAGYAGLTLARRLSRALSKVEVVVVDETPYHLVQHELHRVVRNPELADIIRVPLSEALPEATVREARVTDVHREEQKVVFESGEELGYDYVALCLGAETAFYDLPGVEEHALPLKRLGDAEAIRASVDAAPDGHAVVGGAGLSGVQIAGELAALAAEREDELTVTLLEQRDSVAPSFPANFRQAVRDELETRDVRVRTGAVVRTADDEAVELTDGDRIVYDTFVWTGGIRGPAALDGERVRARADLRIDERTFVVGDAARVVDADGEAVPASAAAAIREARTVADSITSLVDGVGRPEQFRFKSPGWAVSIGDSAVVTLGPTVLRGRAARMAKATVAAGHLASVGASEDALAMLREELY